MVGLTVFFPLDTARTRLQGNLIYFFSEKNYIQITIKGINVCIFKRSNINMTGILVLLNL